MSSTREVFENANPRFRSLQSHWLVPISLNKTMVFTVQRLMGRFRKWCRPPDSIQLVGLLLRQLTDSTLLMQIAVYNTLLQITPWCLLIMLLSRYAAA